MLETIRSGKAPHLVLLSYTSDYRVRDVVAIPKRFIVEEIVLPRKPLGSHCKRAGWQGCNLDIGMLPPDGKVECLSNFARIPDEEVRSNWLKTTFLDNLDSASRGWLAVTMGMISKLEKRDFTLSELYALEATAMASFPENKNVRPKIRQQLQRLRDLGWLIFHGNGKYSRAS